MTCKDVVSKPIHAVILALFKGLGLRRWLDSRVSSRCRPASPIGTDHLPMRPTSQRRPHKTSIHAVAVGPELPLRAGDIEPPSGLTLAGCLRDGLPVHWGRLVLARTRRGHSTSIVKDATSVQVMST